MFEFNGFNIIGILFSGAYPDTDHMQGILMKGKMSSDSKEKLIFAIIRKEDDGSFSVFDEAILPLPTDCEAAKTAKVTIGDKLTTATLQILADTAEISITFADADIEYYTETYIFRPARNLREI